MQGGPRPRTKARAGTKLLLHGSTPTTGRRTGFCSISGLLQLLMLGLETFVHILPFRRKQVSEKNLEHGNTTGVTARNCCRILRYVFLAVSRVEICHDRRDRRSCKIFTNCVNFSRKQRVFLHNFCKSTCQVWFYCWNFTHWVKLERKLTQFTDFNSFTLFHS